MNKNVTFAKAEWCSGIMGHFSRLKIRHKLVIMISLIGIVLIIVQLTLSQMLLSIYNKKLHEQATQILNVAAVNIDNELRKIENMSFNVFSDEIIQDALEKLSNQQPTDAGYSNTVREVTERLYTLISGIPSVLTVDFVDNKGTEFTIGRINSSINYNSEIDVAGQLLKLTSDAKGHCVWAAKDTDVMVCARMVRKIRNLSFEEMGMFAFSIDIRHLVRNLSYFSASPLPHLAIVFENETIFKTSDFPADPAQLEPFPAEGYIIEKIGEEDYFITRITSKHNAWQYISMTSMANIYSNINKIEALILAIMAVIIFAVLWAGMQASVSITKPLEALQHRMKDLQKGDFHHGISVHKHETRDEVAQLTRDFEIMVGNIDELIYQNYTKQLAMKDSQYKLLQTQINPHFLYNTLDSINWMAKNGGHTEISEMVEALANLFRQTINMGDGSISVGTELELLSSYLVIQKIRMAEQLDYKVHASDDVLGYLMPKFTLQPLVENCIQHGYNHDTGHVNIDISIRFDGDMIECSVMDNGPGMPADILEQLHSGKVISSGLHIGLRNIDERLRLAFGGRYEFLIDKTDNSLTRVTVRFPAKTS